MTGVLFCPADETAIGMPSPIGASAGMFAFAINSDVSGDERGGIGRDCEPAPCGTVDSRHGWSLREDVGLDPDSDQQGRDQRSNHKLGATLQRSRRRHCSGILARDDGLFKPQPVC